MIQQMKAEWDAKVHSRLLLTSPPPEPVVRSLIEQRSRQAWAHHEEDSRIKIGLYGEMVEAAKKLHKQTDNVDSMWRKFWDDLDVIYKALAYKPESVCSFFETQRDYL